MSEGGGELRHAGIDRQIRRVHPAELLRTLMSVHQGLPWNRNFEQLISTGRHLSQARTDRQHEIGLLDASSVLGVDRDADVADVLRMIIVEEILQAERAVDWEHPDLC